MQRIINDPNMVVEDMLKGFERCHADILHVDEGDPRVVVSNFVGQGEPRVGIELTGRNINATWFEGKELQTL